MSPSPSPSPGSPVPLTLSLQRLFSHVKIENLIAGLSGGVVSTLVLHPLDLVKIRFAGKLKSHLLSRLAPEASFILNLD